MAFAKPSLKGRALRLLGAREHSRLELERKLAVFEEQAGTLAHTLDELQAKGFIDEHRVMESVLHRRSAKQGIARIRQALQDKGLSNQLIEEAVAALKGSELQRAREVWRKKFGSAAANPIDHAKQMRFLLSRGFAAEVVRRILAGSDQEGTE